MHNTKKRGVLHFITFEEKNGGYCAVCLNFNLIEWGEDIDELRKSINEAAMSYLEGVIENNLPDELLNRPAPNKYWEIAEQRVQPVTKIKPKRNKHSFFNFANLPYSNGAFISA